MVFIAPDPSTILGPALQQLAAGIGNAINPDYAIQQNMKMNLATNPELISKLADAEAKAPGTLRTLGLGKLTGQITQTPESPEGEVERTQRPALVKTAQNKVKTAESQSEIGVDTFTKAIELMRKDPSITIDTALRQLIGETGSERTIKEKGAEVATAEAPAKIAQAGVQKTAAEAAQKNLPALEGYDFDNAARQFLSGMMSGAEAQALFITPGAGQSFQEAIDAVKQERALAAQEHWKTYQHEATTDDLLTRQAFQLYTGTDYSGTLDAWKTIISDPKGAEAIRDVVPEKRTPEEKQVVAALDAQDRYNRAAKAKQVNDLNNTIRTAWAALNTSISKGESEENQNLLKSNLNAALLERSAITGKYYRAEVGRRPGVGEAEYSFLGTWNEGKGLYFIDANGNRVKAEEVFQTPTETSTTSDKQFDADVMQNFTILQADDPARRKARLDAVAKRDPKMFKALDSLFKNQK